MRILAALLVLLHVAALPQAAAAQVYGARLVSTTSWTEEWDPAEERWVRVPDEAEAGAQGAPVTTITTHIVDGAVVSETVETVPAHSAARFAVPLRDPAAALPGAQYGPFRVLDEKRAALVGSTDSQTPAQFDAMLRDHPGLRVLELVEAPGTRNDVANFAVGRRIRAAGLATHVPDGGSVRSGAVELFLAGTVRTLAPGAVFAVHSWQDNYGREAEDLAADAPEHRLYLDYYAEMGLSDARAKAFYAMTNSVPHAQARWLDAAEMRGWIAPEVRAVEFAMEQGALTVPMLAATPVELAWELGDAPRIAASHAPQLAGL